MRRNQLPPHPRATYVMPQHKAVYVAISKAACTSLKWLVADLQGERPERFHGTLAPMVSRDMCIHLRRLFRQTPMLHSLDDDELAAIGPENGWFVFTVVRHPSTRLFSAWQSKLLLREPRWHARHGRDPWFPRVPRSTADVVEDFERFSEAIAADPDGPVMSDSHFRPQWRKAATDRVPYTRVYDTSEIPDLMRDFEEHLRAQGFEGDLRLRQSNETPLRPVRSVYTPRVQEVLTTLYDEDFRGFGYDDVIPPRLDPTDEWPEPAFEEIARLVERNERIGDMARGAKELRAELRAARAAAESPARGGADGRGHAGWNGLSGLAARVRRKVGASLPAR